MTTFAYVPDLMDRSKVTSAYPDAVVVARPADLSAAGPGDVVLVDLARPGALEAVAPLSASGVRVVGFGSHVDQALLDSARAAGVQEVLPRSVFFSRLRSGL